MPATTKLALPRQDMVINNHEVEKESRRADLNTAWDAVAATSSMRLVSLGMATSVNFEDTYLMTDATICYLNGADAATVFCVHASCERDLAALIQHSDSPPANSEKWGLGAIISHCTAVQLVPQDLLDELQTLNNNRKSLYHYGHSSSETGLVAQTDELISETGAEVFYEQFQAQHGHTGSNRAVFSLAMDRVLRRNALHALHTGLALRAWIAGQCHLP